MNLEEQTVTPVSCTDRGQSAGFIAACAGVFIASVAVTVYFCHSMNCDMKMPGCWTMSMMWMPMPRQTWAASAASFLLMWLAMMLAMMLPSALPMFLNTRRALGENGTAGTFASLLLMAAGYFTIWLAAGAAIYLLGIEFASSAMRWTSFSRVVPVLTGVLLVAVGSVQFTRWKMSCLLRCRSPLGCAATCLECEKNFLLGCKQGAACCACCAAPMMIQLSLGVMNPLLMFGIAAVIAVEKLLPRPVITVRLVGIAAFAVGIMQIWHGGILN